MQYNLDDIDAWYAWFWLWIWFEQDAIKHLELIWIELKIHWKSHGRTVLLYSILSTNLIKPLITHTLLIQWSNTTCCWYFAKSYIYIFDTKVTQFISNIKIIYCHDWTFCDTGFILGKYICMKIQKSFVTRLIGSDFSGWVLTSWKITKALPTDDVLSQPNARSIFCDWSQVARECDWNTRRP